MPPKNAQCSFFFVFFSESTAIRQDAGPRVAVVLSTP